MELFDEYGFPAIYPPETLEEMRSQLRISDEEFRQLHLCFDAASNLYARIPLKKLYELCRSYFPTISQADFLDAAEVIAHEKGNPYAIVRRELFHEELPPGGPLDRELVADHLYTVGDEHYYETETTQEGKPWYTPDLADFIRYADEFYVEPTPQQDILLRYLQNTQRSLHCPPDALAESLLCLLRMDEDLQVMIHEAQRLGIRFQDQQDFQHFLALLLNLSHHTRRYSLRGHTPAELALPKKTVEAALKEASYDSNYVDPLDKLGQLLRANAKPTTTSGKTARNAPCPCGSGRKYKNCCGK